MRNKLLLTASLCVVMIFSFQANAVFERVEGYNKPLVYEEEAPFQPGIMRVFELHRLQNALNNQESLHEDALEAAEERDLEQQRFDAMTQCNVNRLREFFVDPETAWKNITKTYDNAEKKLAVSILQSPSSAPVSSQEEDIAEQTAYWSLGRDILMDVYANPQKYGNPRNQFPLWRDQQYMYIQQVTDFVAAVNQFFGRKGAIAGLRQENSYQQNQQAYKSFLKQMALSYPQLIKKLPTALASLPPPPKALPPAQEILLYTSDPEQTKSVYPQWPAPWKKFIESGFTKYNPTGEMAEEFIPGTLRFSEKASKRDQALQNNRLNVYQDLKKIRDAAQKDFEVHQQLEMRRYDEISQDIKALNLTVPDWKDPASVKAFKQTLIEEKLKEIQKTSELLAIRKKRIADRTSAQVGTQAFEEQMDKSYGRSNTKYQDFLDAAKKDIDGRSSIALSNAKNVQQYLDEEDAVTALKEETRKMQKSNRKKRLEKPLDKTCMNGGF